MANYGLGSQGIQALSLPLMINSQCSALNLSGNVMDYRSLTQLALVLEENKSITELNLSRTGITQRGAASLAYLIRRNTILKMIDLSENGLNDNAGEIICQSLEKNRHLKDVILRGNCFSPVCCEAIKNLIAENSSIESLDLSWNHIRKHGAIHAANGIKENFGLKRINLSWNGFEDQGAQAIATALRVNGSLQVLDLTCNRITGKGLLAIVRSLDANYSLTDLVFGRNHVSEAHATTALQLIMEMTELTLIHLDLAEILLPKSLHAIVDQVRAVHEEFRCTWGYTDSYGKRKLQTYNAVDEAFQFMQQYISQHNINLAELFAKFDADGSMSVTYDEFKEGLKDAGIPMTPQQVDQLITFLDQDGDGEIDFSELVIGTEVHERQKQHAKDINEKLLSQNSPNV